MVRDWRLIPPKLTKEAWNSLINDFVELSPIPVKKNDGADLVETINAYAEERTIVPPKGMYLVDDPIDVANLVLKGMGKGFVTIKANATMGEIINISNHKQAKIKGITFDCNSKATNAVLVNNNFADAALDFIFNENEVLNSLGYAVKFNQPVGSHQSLNVVRHNIFHTCKGGIYGNCTDSIFTGNGVNDCPDNHLADAYESGIIVFRGANRILGNYLGGGYCHGIYVYACDGTVISHNIIDHWWMHGIVLRGASETTIVGGKITTCGRAASNTYDGIRLESSGVPTPCTYNNITGVTIKTDAAPFDLKYGIHEVDANQDYNKFNHCILKGVFGTAPVLKQGANSQDNT